jgi:iron-sulfur cluster insertion protein
MLSARRRSMSVLTITEAAATKVRELMSRDDREGYGLRLKVVGGGCSGLQYQLMFDNQVGDLDEDEEQRGVRVIVDPKSAVYLIGTTVDYVDDLNGAGFKIENPNATATCGCGQSFGA